MQAILSVTVPFFALILIGYTAARSGLLPLDSVPGLNTFVLYVALPAMLMRFGMNTPVLELFDPVVMGLYLAAAAVLVATAVLAGRRMGLRLKDASFSALVAAFPNSGFIGVPLLVALLGTGAAGPVICTLLGDIFITTGACVALAQAGEATRGQALFSRLKTALLAPLRNPQPWAIALGALLSVLQWRLPGPVDSVVRMLADAASPVALFTLGAVLWRTRSPAGTGSRAPLVWGIVAFKLMLHPALVFGLCMLLRALGLALSDLTVVAVTLVAALPSASNVVMLAERYGADNGLVARIVLGSTAAAFGSFSLLAWLFGIQPVG